MGPPCPDNFRIKLDNQDYLVRESLWWALRHIQLKDSPRTLWIDAICFDQSNNQERNHQVSQMGRIYSRASNIVAWIGLEEDNTKLVQEFLHEISFDKNRHLSQRQITKYEKDMRYGDQLALKVAALLAVCHRPYWTRLWIIQELKLSHRGIVQCGSISFDLASFRRFNAGSWIEFCRWADDESAAEMASSPAMRQFEITRRDWGARTLLDLVRFHSEAECEEPRDRIFDLLNLCQDCCRVALPADYRDFSKKLVSIF
jgi:hypothetical protein